MDLCISGRDCCPLAFPFAVPAPPSPSVLLSTSPLPRSSVGGDFNQRWQSLFKDRHIKTPSNVGLTDDDASAGIPHRSSVPPPCLFLHPLLHPSSAMFPNDSQWTQVLSESEKGYAAILALQRPFSWDDHTDAMPRLGNKRASRQKRE
jgi:hypothetical protein